MNCTNEQSIIYTFQKKKIILVKEPGDRLAPIRCAEWCTRCCTPLKVAPILDNANTKPTNNCNL